MPEKHGLKQQLSRAEESLTAQKTLIDSQRNIINAVATWHRDNGPRWKLAEILGGRDE